MKVVSGPFIPSMCPRLYTSRAASATNAAAKPRQNHAPAPRSLMWSARRRLRLGREPHREDVLRIEVLAYRADPAVAKFHQQVIELVVHAPVLELAQRFGLERDLVALGDHALHRHAQAALELLDHAI